MAICYNGVQFHHFPCTNARGHGHDRRTRLWITCTRHSGRVPDYISRFSPRQELALIWTRSTDLSYSLEFSPSPCCPGLLPEQHIPPLLVVQPIPRYFQILLKVPHFYSHIIQFIRYISFKAARPRFASVAATTTTQGIPAAPPPGLFPYSFRPVPPPGVKLNVDPKAALPAVNFDHRQVAVAWDDTTSSRL